MRPKKSNGGEIVDVDVDASNADMELAKRPKMSASLTNMEAVRIGPLSLRSVLQLQDGAFPGGVFVAIGVGRNFQDHIGNNANILDRRSIR